MGERKIILAMIGRVAAWRPAGGAGVENGPLSAKESDFCGCRFPHQNQNHSAGFQSKNEEKQPERSTKLRDIDPTLKRKGGGGDVGANPFNGPSRSAATESGRDQGFKKHGSKLVIFPLPKWQQIVSGTRSGARRAAATKP